MSDDTFNVSPTLRNFILKPTDFKIGKLIGQGNSGNVYLATHLHTGKKCSYKELFMERLKGKEKIHFSREIEILVKCDNMFVLKFYGWTSEYPYSIITEYIPNGSLFNALKHQPDSPNLSPTNKTLIAIGIANGMMSLHNVGIIHRDLKSLNVLLDENLLPKICDFGLSRFTQDEHNAMSIEIGTPCWMAPEIFESRNYTNKVDVYSFGIVMWEMLTESVPFKGLNAIQVAIKITKENERPEIPPNTPKSLRSLIKKCWDRDPNKRPTFSQIYRFLLRKAAFYPGTDLNAIDKLVAEIKNQEFKRSKKSNSRISDLKSKEMINTIAMKTNSNLKDIKEDPNNARSPFTKTLSPNSADFRSEFTDCLNYLTKETYSKFNKMLIDLFAFKNINEGSLILILRELLKLVSNQRYLTRFVNDQIYKKIPLDARKLSYLSLEILLQVTLQHPEIIDLSFMKYLNPVFSIYPQRILRIISPLFSQYSKNQRKFDVPDFLIQNPKPFILYSGAEYLRTLFFLCSNYPAFFRSRIEYIINILCTAIFSHDTQTVIADYSFICYIFDERITLPISVVTNHLINDDIRNYALSYLIRKSHIELTTSLVLTLLRVSPLSKLAFQLLCKYLTGSTSTRQYLIENFPNWMEDDRTPIKISISIALIIEADIKLRKYMANSPQFLSLFKRIIKSYNPALYAIGCQMITKSMPNTKFIEKLIKSNFFSKFFENLKKFDDQQELLVIHDAIEMIDQCSKTTFIPDFLIYIPKMILLILDPNYSVYALSALFSLSNYSRASNAMKKSNIEDILKKIQKNENNQIFIDKIVQNINK